MRQASLKLKSYVSNINIIDNSDLQKRILRVILVSFSLLSLCYVLVVGGIIFNIIERKALETEARNLGNEVGEMELTYLSKSGEIDLSMSQSLGFKEVKADFVVRKSLESLAQNQTFSNSGTVRLAKNEI